MNPSYSEFLPSVSILISTKDRRYDLKNALDSIKGLDYPKEKIEIIVVEETDNPQPIDGVKYIVIPREGRGFGYTRNVAIKNASHEIVVFTDDDCIVEMDWLKTLVKGFKDEGVAGVAGGVAVKNANIIGKCEIILGFPGGGLKYIYNSMGKPHETTQLSTCNCAFRKKVFDVVGYFHEDTKHSGEDYELAQRVSRKYKCLYNPEAIVYHKPRGTLYGVFKWFIRRGNTQISVMKIDKPYFFGHLWWLLKTSIILRIILLSVLFSSLNINLSTGFSSLLIIYWVVIVFRYRFYYRYYPEIAIAFVLPAIKLTMDFGMDAGKIEGLLKYLRITK
jgi:GT2 family glycosyltransferase